ncbi:hypothetical protein KP509_13G054700 [Ceratopteris richardii]|uniref:NB-ARC domain-containing protein n=1 Tax=Ceratopteris richardii TaxID=49495 RepID=A0A8T2TFR6_CERRI|nr:hypothetical protein KP509_13G054700 [Ceratopteris richardii]
MSPFVPIGEVCQVATMMLQGVRSLGESARNHKEAIPKIELLEATVRQLVDLQGREQARLRGRKHHAEQGAALESLENLCHQLEQQVAKAKKITAKKGLRLRLYNLRGALFGASGLSSVATMMETLITSWMKLQNVPAEIREALQRSAGSLPVYLEVQSNHGYMPLRAKAHKVRELLENSENKVLLLHGMSGIGKSSLARFVAAEPPRRFTDGALELVLGQACSITGSSDDPLEYQKLLTVKLSSILRMLGCKKDQLEGLTLESSWMLLQEVLEGKSYLIVLDDVWELDITTRFSRLTGNDCKILVTTRNESVYAIAGADKVEIREPDVKEVGKAILMYHTKLSKLPDIWDDLLERCAYHPLTISVIGEALSGETRREEWLKAMDNLSMYAAKAIVPATYQSTPLDNASCTVFGSFQFSLRALPRDARDLFTSFALILWTEPIPEICLEKLWGALRPHSLFRLEVGKLVKGSLITKPDSKFCYRMHGMVSLFLSSEISQALSMLQLSELSVDHCGLNWVVAAVWLFRYGKPEVKEASASYIRAALRSGVYVFQVTVLHTVVELLDLVCSITEVSIMSELSITTDKFKKMLDEEIINMISCGEVHPLTAIAISHYIRNLYSSEDYKRRANDLINAGVVNVLSSILHGSESGKVTETMYEALGVVYELVKFGDANSSEVLLRNAPVKELVGLYYVGLAMDTLEKLCELGGESVVQEIFEEGLWEKLVNDCRDQLGLLWPRRERSIIKDRFLRLLSDRSQNDEDEEWSVSKSLEHDCFAEVHGKLERVSGTLVRVGRNIEQTAGDEQQKLEDLEKEAILSLSVAKTSFKSLRGAPTKPWEEIMRSTKIASSVLKLVCAPSTPAELRHLAADCLCEINHHPSSTSILMEILTSEALDEFLRCIAYLQVEEEVSCRLFEVLEYLLNNSSRQDEIIEKGIIELMFEIILSRDELRPKLQEKVLFYIVFSPLHVKRRTSAWIELLLESGVVQALATLPTISNNTNLPVLPFWFLCKFGTCIAKTDRLQTLEQTKLAADFMRRMQAALPQICSGESDEDIKSIEALLKP